MLKANMDASLLFRVGILLTIMSLLLYYKIAFGYDTGAGIDGANISEGKPVHQYITRQAINILDNENAKLEFNTYSQRADADSIDPAGAVIYSPVNRYFMWGTVKADDLISGAAEEDAVKLFADVYENCSGDALNGFFEHFWDPDDPWIGGFNCNTIGGAYNAGLPKKFLFQSGHYDSAYRLAQYYWDRKAIPLYSSGDRQQAYYWLGRIAHLLQDMTVPAHAHDRYHDPIVNGDSDLFEDYASGVYTNYNGDSCVGKYYKYENLINYFQWGSVHDQANPPDLFKLFWYTDQKTQYFATASSKGETADNWANWAIGNNRYVLWNKSNAEPQLVQFSRSLWDNEDLCIGQTVINQGIVEYLSDPNNLFNSLSREYSLRQLANALIPHALKATAGLYRLFWNEVHPQSNVMPLPTGQESFSYLPAKSPVVNTVPSEAKPIGVGSVATGGNTLSLQVSLPEFSVPIDIYLAISAPSISTDIFIIKSDLSLQPLSMGLAKWRENTTGPVDESLYRDISISSLPNGRYSLYVLVTPVGNQNAYYLWETYFDVTQTISAPTGLTATPKCDGCTPGIELQWNAISGAIKYEVYRNGSWIYTTGTSTPYFWNTTGLTAGQSYQYQIKAKNDTTTSGFSNTAIAIAPDCGGDTIPPSIPIGLTAAAVSSTQINLSWNASTDNVGVVGYKIYRNSSYLKSVNITSASDTGLSPSTQYCYTVSAYDAAGNESAQSNQVYAVTPSTPVLSDPFIDTVVTINDIAEGLTFDSLNNLYISTVSGKVVKLNGDSLSIFIAEGVGELDFDKHIRFSQGNFYIHNVLNVGTALEHIDEILLFNSAGTFVRRLLDEKDIGAYFFEDIVVNAQGQLYVAPFTSSNNIVVRIDSNGQNLTNVIKLGDDDVFVPVSLAIDSNGNLYVGGPGVVSKFDSNGNFKGKIVQDGINGFKYAANLAVDYNDNLYVGNVMLGTDSNSTIWNVLRFGSNSTFLGEFIKAGTAGLSAFPEDMGFDTQGRLYIADSLGAVDGIVRFDQSGNFDRIGVKNFGVYSSSLIKSSMKSKQQEEKYRHYREIELKNKALTEEFAQRTQSVK